MKRVTVTLPEEIVEAIDRLEANRSRFVLESVQSEIERRRRDALRTSLTSPHAETKDIVEEDFETWAGRLPDDEASELIDPGSGTPVRWIPGQGWMESES